MSLPINRIRYKQELSIIFQSLSDSDNLEIRAFKVGTHYNISEAFATLITWNHDAFKAGTHYNISEPQRL